MQKSGFFNSVNGDRKYNANFFAEYFASFIGNGVFPNPSTNLQVLSANNGYNITIKSGKGWINGYYYCNTTDYNILLDVADGVLNRIDRMVLRFNTSSRDITLQVKKGTFASSPVAPSLQRDADMYELGLADIYIKAGAISITQADITDLRLNKNMCGLVHGVVEQVDTTAIFNQFENWYSTTKTNYDTDITKWTKEKKEAFEKWYADNIEVFKTQWTDWFSNNTSTWSTDFTTWFNAIKGQLSGDIATNLASKVDKLENNYNTISISLYEKQDITDSNLNTDSHNIVGAINENNLSIKTLNNSVNILKERIVITNTIPTTETAKANTFYFIPEVE